jgi:hypothetical protein
VAAIMVAENNYYLEDLKGFILQFDFCRYMVYVSALCAGYAIVAAVCSWIRYLVTKAWIFFISDQVRLLFLILNCIFHSIQLGKTDYLLDLSNLHLLINIKKYTISLKSNYLVNYSLIFLLTL